MSLEYFGATVDYSGKRCGVCRKIQPKGAKFKISGDTEICGRCYHNLTTIGFRDSYHNSRNQVDNKVVTLDSKYPERDLEVNVAEKI